MRITPRGLLFLKAALHLSFIVPLAYLAMGVVSDSLGGDPVQYLIHFTGKGALHILMLTLLVSPLARWLKAGALLQCRRLIGVWAFVYALVHMLLFLSLDLLFAWQLLLEEVVKRPYLVVGMLGFIILLLLTLTSPMAIRRRMGRSWQSLHNLVYLAAVLLPVHYLWSVKSEVIEPGLYLLGCLLLLWIRRDKLKRRAVRPAPQPPELET